MPQLGEIKTNPANPRQQAKWNGREWVQIGGPPAKAPKLSVQEQKQLQNAREGAVSAQASVRDGERFLDVNRKTGTGELNAIPFVSEVRSVFDPSYAEMMSLTSRMAPMQRQPGSGSSSDKDVQMFKRAVPNTDYPGPTNTKIVSRLKEEADLKTRYAEFLDDYVAQNGTLVGAQSAWSKVQSAKPAPKGAPAKAAPKTQGNGWTIKEVR
jgi:hypothetical protein